MRSLFILVVLVFSFNTLAVEWEDKRRFTGNEQGVTLRVVSSTDTAVFAPIIEKFLIEYPNLNIEYWVAGSTDIYDSVLSKSHDFDVVISSAMDLQLKLVNDGYASPIDDIDYPDWAHWRQSLFGFTLEPAAIVVNKSVFNELALPASRQDLIEVLRENPDTFRGRIGTYDVRQSGLGYLFATQDARRSETYWRLTEIMGSLDTRVYCCSGQMLDDLAKGTIAISYNVLGSYALARLDIADKIDVILPSEFPITMMRTAFVSKHAPQPNAARSFLRYLTSSQWQSNGNGISLPALQNSVGDSQRSVISLEPGLLVFLDRMKRQLFIKEWERAIIQ